MRGMILTAMAVAVLAGAAVAAPPARAPQLDAIAKCRAERDDARRLACYDRSVGALVDASGKGEVVVVDREEVRKTRRGLFGFSVEKSPWFKGDRLEDIPDVLETTIKQVRGTALGKFVVTVETGAVWQLTETVQRDPRVGQTVTIKRGTLGGYFFTPANGRTVRAIRVG